MKKLEWAEEEVRYLEQLRPDAEVTVAPPALQWKGLAGMAAAVQPTIFHFIGHGDRRGQLYVPEDGKYHGRSAAKIIKVVRSVSKGLEGVYLSACFSATDGPELLEELPPAAGWAIGTGLKVDDDLAAKFSEAFYAHVVRNAGTPKEAFDVAYAYTVGDWDPDEVPHAGWFRPSLLPPVDQMEQTISDEIWKFFNRPAFQTPARYEVSIAELDDALQHVSHALGTGQMLSRKTGRVISDFSIPSKWLQDPEIDQFVRRVRPKITVARRVLAEVRAGLTPETDYVAGNVLNFDPTVPEAVRLELVNAVDHARNEVLKEANKLFVRNNLQPFDTIKLSFDDEAITKARARSVKP